MRQQARFIFGFVAVALFGVGCGKDDSGSGWHGGDSHALSQQDLAAIANLELTISVPEICPASEDEDVEGLETLHCENWLGMRLGGIGLTHHQQRLSFSIEEVDDKGRFRIAAYPDCMLDERIAAAAAAMPELHTEELEEPEPYTSIRTGLEDVISDEEPPPLLGDADLNVAAPADDETGFRDGVVEALAKPPFPECRRLIAPGALGDPVEILDPASAGDRGWWQVRVAEGETPVFVSMENCHSGSCKTRLLLGEGDTLVTAEDVQGDLALLGFFKKLKGSLSKAWNSGVQTVADAAKSVGSVKTIDKLGGKKLYVAAATPAVRLYSAVKEQGPQAVSLANGVVKEGAVYAQIGAKYAEVAGQATLTGLVYIAEYIQANACFIGVSTGLSTAVAREAAFYEAPLTVLAQTFAEDLATQAAFDILMSNKKGPFYQTINGAATAIAIPTSLVSSRFNAAEWRGILIDILGSAMTGDVKGGFVGIIIGKIAEAICLGVDKATSPHDATENVISANGISDSCLDSIKSHAVKRAEKGEDICYAMRDEINIEAAKAKPSHVLVESWESGGETGACPTDPEAEAYHSLLEGIGCKESRVYLEDQPKVDPTTNLVANRYWARTSDWFANLTCGKGELAVGMCASGGSPDCYGMPKELLCAKRPGGGNLTQFKKVSTPIGKIKVVASVDIIKNTSNTSIAICPEGYAVTEFCSSGGNKDCDGAYQKMRCSQINTDFQVDYGNCTLKQAKTWSARLQATTPNDVIVGMCSSGKKPDCGQKRDVTKSALFCPIVPAAASDGTRVLTRYTRGDDTLLTAYIGENPYGYDYDGAFRVYTENAPGRRPLVRCRTGGGHMISNATNCEGATNEGLLGYTSITGEGTPLIRCVKGNHHFVSEDRQECTDRGYTYEGGLGHQP